MSSTIITSGCSRASASSSLRDAPEQFRDWELTTREAHRRCDPFDDGGAILLLDAEFVDQETDLGHGRLDRVVGRDLGDATHDLGDRPERDSVAVRQTPSSYDVRLA